jgi:hypothetical protein
VATKFVEGLNRTLTPEDLADSETKSRGADFTSIERPQYEFLVNSQTQYRHESAAGDADTCLRHIRPFRGASMVGYAWTQMSREIAEHDLQIGGDPQGLESGDLGKSNHDRQ